jgi:hypothetical protein
MIETEEKDERLRELLRDSKDFRVPDGFVNGVFEKAEARRSKSFSFGYRFGIPAVAAMALLVAFLGSSLFSGNEAPEVADKGAVDIPNPSPQSNPAILDSDTLNGNPTLKTPSITQGTNPIPADEETEVRTEAVKPAPQVRLGAGAKSSGSNPSVGGAAIKPEIILSILGVDCDFEDNGWKVKSVTPQSVASKAGVKAGDVIEAVNDVALTKDGVFLRSLSVDRIVVRRSGARSTLRLAGN